MGDPKAIYTEAIETFKQKCIKTIDDMKTWMDGFEKNANEGFEEIQKTYVGGSSELRNQLMRGNRVMVTQFQETSLGALQEYKLKLDKIYKTVAEDNLQRLQSNVSKFKEQYEHILCQVPLVDTKDNAGKEENILKVLDHKKGDAVQFIEARLQEAKKALKDNIDDTIKKLELKAEELQVKRKQ